MQAVSYKKRVAVLRGGPSSEYEFSMLTGAGVLSALSESPYATKDIIISKKGEWLVKGFVKSPEQALMDIDVVFIALHGAYGEDGTVQRILERLAIPYTGSGSYASAIAMNKLHTKDFLKKHTDAIKMAPHMKITKEGTSNVPKLVHTITEMFGPEYVIKPISGGSSVGTKVVAQGDLLKEVIASLETDPEILIEQRIKGREATVGILENFRDQRYYQLPEIEIVPPQGASFFSADVKYTGETEEICPGRFSKSEKKELLETALLVHTALGLRQYSRSDFIVAENLPATSALAGQAGGVYFLEVNTLPGLTAESLFPKSIAAVGSSYKELVTHLLETA